ncbi:Ubiquitin carboxyl-terminal hydrolase 47 [Balamuthia mandrillaris]
MEMQEGDSATWACPCCTLLNDSWRIYCEVCEAPSPTPLELGPASLSSNVNTHNYDDPSPSASSHHDDPGRNHSSGGDHDYCYLISAATYDTPELQLFRQEQRKRLFGTEEEKGRERTGKDGGENGHEGRDAGGALGGMREGDEEESCGAFGSGGGDHNKKQRSNNHPQATPLLSSKESEDHDEDDDNDDDDDNSRFSKTNGGKADDGSKRGSEETPYHQEGEGRSETYLLSKLSGQQRETEEEALRSFKTFFEENFGGAEGYKDLVGSNKDLADKLYNISFKQLLLPLNRKKVSCTTAVEAWKALSFKERFSLWKHWKSFLLSKGDPKNRINADVWGCLLEFAEKVDPNLENYSPTDSWPTIIDEFVDYTFDIWGKPRPQYNDEMYYGPSTYDTAMAESYGRGDGTDRYNYSGSSSFEWRSKDYRGLYNQGATCYMNSLLQTLFMTPEFRASLYRWKYTKQETESESATIEANNKELEEERIDGEDKNQKQDEEQEEGETGVDDGEYDEEENQCIPFQLQRLFARMQFLEHKYAISTEALTKSFGWEGREAFEQQDAQELCRVLFDALEDSFENSSEKGIVQELYEGKMIDYVKCRECGYQSSREDKYLDISLDIHNTSSLEQALDRFVTPEILSGTSQWRCSGCNNLVDAEKGLKPQTFPYVLMIQLKRFDYNWNTETRVKLNHYVQFPMILNVKKYLGDDFKPDVIVHPEENRHKERTRISSTSSFSLPNFRFREGYEAPKLVAEQAKKLRQDIDAIRKDIEDDPTSPLCLFWEHQLKGKLHHLRALCPEMLEEEEEEEKEGQGKEPIEERTHHALEEILIDIDFNEPDRSEKLDGELAQSPENGASSNGDRTSSLPSIDTYEEGDIEAGYVYELYSVLIHSGSSSGGHYYAYIKSFEKGGWYNFNDSSVTEISSSQIKDTFGTSSDSYWQDTSYGASAYMLIYRRVHPDNMSTVPVKDIPKALREIKDEDEYKVTFPSSNSNSSSSGTSIAASAYSTFPSYRHTSFYANPSDDENDSDAEDQWSEDEEDGLESSTLNLTLYLKPDEKQLNFTRFHQSAVRNSAMRQEQIIIHSQRTLEELLERAKELFGLNIPMDCLRARFYDFLLDVPGAPLDFVVSQGSLYSLNVQDNNAILIEIKAENEQFSQYNPQAVMLKVVEWQNESDTKQPPHDASIDDALTDLTEKPITMDLERENCTASPLRGTFLFHGTMWIPKTFTFDKLREKLGKKLPSIPLKQQRLFTAKPLSCIPRELTETSNKRITEKPLSLLSGDIIFVERCEDFDAPSPLHRALMEDLQELNVAFIKEKADQDGVDNNDRINGNHEEEGESIEMKVWRTRNGYESDEYDDDFDDDLFLTPSTASSSSSYRSRYSSTGGSGSSSYSQSYFSRPRESGVKIIKRARKKPSAATSTTTNDTKDSAAAPTSSLTSSQV